MSRPKTHEIQITAEERVELETILKKGKHNAPMLRRAQMLLWMVDGRSDKEIQELLNISPSTLTNVRKKWVTERTVEDKPRSGRPRKLDGKQEAFLIALACSHAPDGYKEWTMQLMADRMIELGVVDSISDETIRLTLKKRSKAVAA